MYSRPITVYQGIDNPVQVVVKNQDQKSIDLTGYALQADIQDPVNQVTALSFAVDYIDQTKGLGFFLVDRLSVNSLQQRFYKITLKLISESDDTERPIYVDDNYGVPLDFEVLPAYYDRTETPPPLNEVVIDSGTLPL